ncbi:MAG: CsgG/HfaB family protein [Marivita sp.]|uniref:CsgG/HfaB family protein n=1 Tax=Marivita sp. TaxID=2003365 RepID=UPI003EF80111
MKFQMCAYTVIASFFLSACALPDTNTLENGQGNAPVLAGVSVTENRTPVDDALSCYGDALSLVRKSRRPLGIAVGDVRDFTGRLSDSDGAPITQGAGLMMYSALASIGPSIRIHERLDPRVAELELSYLDRQRLGDGQMHQASLDSIPTPWMPYMGGSILQSDYYIVGGVTELNHSLVSGGGEALIGGAGGRSRYSIINVAVDLRIVNTRNLVVEHAVSLQKQVIGQEVGFDIFSFFDTRLFDIKAGTQMVEPMQMAVRSILQLASLDLLEAISEVPNEACVRLVQPNLDRKLPRPRPPKDTRNWPPAAESSVAMANTKSVLKPPATEALATQPDLVDQENQTLTQPEQQSLAPVGGGVVVVGAGTSAEAAIGVWKSLKQNNPDLFAEVQADMVSVNRDGGPFLVVVQHPKKQASAYCEVAKAVGVECLEAPPEVLAALDTVRANSQN